METCSAFWYVADKHNILDEIIDNVELKETIISYKPKDGKKGSILNLAIQKNENGENVLVGLKNTILALENALA